MADVDPNNPILFHYLPGISGSVIIHKKDVKCLAPTLYLDDLIIDFWNRYVYIHILCQEDRDCSVILSTLFYISIRSKPITRKMKWTKGMDVFAKKFVFIPVLESQHWMMAVICFPGLLANKEKNQSNLGQEQFPSSSTIVSSEPMIILFDSFKSHKANRARVFEKLRLFLNFEWKILNPNDAYVFTTDNLPGFSPTVPQQKNSFDCGCFIMEYLEHFFNNPIKSFKPPLPSLENWFDPMLTQDKRERIYKVIVELTNELNPKQCSQLHPDYIKLGSKPDSIQPTACDEQMDTSFSVDDSMSTDNLFDVVRVEPDGNLDLSQPGYGFIYGAVTPGWSFE